MATSPPGLNHIRARDSLEPLTAAQLMAIANSATSRIAAGKSVAVEAPGRAP